MRYYYPDYRDTRPSIRDWYQRLPLEIRAKALSALEPEVQHLKVSNMAQALCLGFVWHNNGGMSYWENIMYSYKN